MLRLVHAVSFQPHLAIVGGTLAMMVPDMAHLAAVLATCATMTAALATTVFGYRVKASAIPLGMFKRHNANIWISSGAYVCFDVMMICPLNTKHMIYIYSQLIR